MRIAPIVLFIYNRAEHTKKTLDALSKCVLAQESNLIVYADGAREGANGEQLQKICNTRKLAHGISKDAVFKSVEIHESSVNKGLAQSIIEGVTETVNKYGRVIVLEDDIVAGKYFLEYMNSALNRYKDEKRVWDVTGFNMPIPYKNEEGSFFHHVPFCWGWGTWADRWAYFEKDTDKLIGTFTKKMICRFNYDGANPDVWEQVLANKSGRMDTWAVFWHATVFLHDGLCLGPMKSLTLNIGFDGTGEHCSETHIYDKIDEAYIDHKVTSFPKKIAISRQGWNAIKRFNIQTVIMPWRIEMKKARKAKNIQKMRNTMKMLKKTAKKIIRFPFKAIRKAYKVVRKMIQKA